MTDEHSHHEEEHEPEQHARINEEGEIEFRDEDGNWHTHEWESTGDPEKDRLMEMRASEFDKILEDENHPLHAKAAELQADMMRPIVESLRKAVFPNGDPFKHLFGSWGEPLANRWMAGQGNLFRHLIGFDFSPPRPVWRAGRWNLAPSQPREIESPAEVEDLEEAPEEDDSGATLEHSAGAVDEPVEGTIVDPLVSALAENSRMVAGAISELAAVNEQRRKDDREAADRAAGQKDESLRLARQANDTAYSNMLISFVALLGTVVAGFAAFVGLMELVNPLR